MESEFQQLAVHGDADGFGAGRNAELGEDGLKVLLDPCQGYVVPAGDVLIGETTADHVQYLQLAGGQLCGCRIRYQ